MAIGFDAQTRAVHHLPGADRLMQGLGQIAAQAFAGHFQDIADARRARGRLQVHAGAAVQVKDVALIVDERAIGCKLPQ